MDILFFSRGRGRGHAIPDMAIMDAVHGQCPEINCKFVSYGTGAATLSEFGRPVVDLQMPDENPFLETLIDSFRVIDEASPRLVISHEEFAAVVAAKARGVPSIFITDWFGNENHIAMQALAYAGKVIFLGNRGVFDEPTFLKGKIIYAGSFMREFKYQLRDREQARSEMSIASEAIVVSVLPGGWATEKRAPIFDLLVPAFYGIGFPRKLLCWVASDEFEMLEARTQGMPDILILRKHWPIEQLMVASDLVVTKGNRITIMEAAALGIPSISLSHGLNPVEDFVVPRINSNLALRIKGIDAKFLSTCLENTLRSSKPGDITCDTPPDNDFAAKVLLGAIKDVFSMESAVA